MKDRFLPLFAVILLILYVHAKITTELPKQDISVARIGTNSSFPGAVTFGLPGDPELPVYYATILLPPDADLNTVSVSIESGKEILLNGIHTVKPVLPHVTSGGLVALEGKTNLRNGKDETVYSSDAFFPRNFIRFVQTGMLRDYKLVDIAVQRYKYNPVSGKLKCLTSGKLTVDFKKELKRPSLNHGVPENARNTVRDLAVNYDEIAGEYSSLRVLQQTGYAIITTSSIKSSSQAIDDFVMVKKSEGYDVEVVTESVWGGGTGDDAMNKIRNWLKNNYRERVIEYAFFLGSADVSSQVPMTWGPTASNKTPLIDYCYADLTGETWDVSKNRFYEYGEEGVADNRYDKYAEVNVGRIPVYSNNVSEMDYCLEKIIRYVTEDAVSAESWRFEVFMALHSFGDAQNGYSFGDYINRNLISGDWSCYRIYDAAVLGAEAYPCSYAKTKECWSAGKFGLMICQGHGLVTFAEQTINTSTAQQLSDDYPSHCFNVSCHNGRPQDGTNVSYAQFRYAGISAIGSAVQIWYNQSTASYGSSAAGNDFGYVYFKHLIKSKLPAAAAFNKCRSELPVSGTSDWQNCTELNLYGCPAVGVYTYDVATGVKDISKNETPMQFTLFCHSTNNTITLMFKNGAGYRSGIVSLYDMQGKLVAKRAVPSRKHSFVWKVNENRKASLSKGMYLLKAECVDIDGNTRSTESKLFFR